MLKVVLKNNIEIITDIDIDNIDNNLAHIGFIRIKDIETNKLFIITVDSLLYVEQN